MYENLKRISDNDDNKPVIIRFVGETLCDDDSFEIVRKNSDLMSFEYIVEGSGTLMINGQTLYPEKGDIFLLTEGSTHRYFSQKENGWHKYFISFHGEIADAFVKNYLPEDTYLFKGCFLENNFSRIFDIAFNSNENEFETVESRLAVELFKIFNFLYDRSVLDCEDFADRICRRIEYYAESEFNLDNLCRDMNYSKNHIINCFTQKFGITPYQYYIECKIKRAKDYLLNTNMNISEIAAALSYSDQQYFSYCFKKTMGMSPRDFRKKAKM